MAIKKVFHSKKLPVRAVSLISYDLLIDFTLENEQTINGFYNAYKAKCEKEFVIKYDVITLNSWKLAVQVFWWDILKLDLLKSFSCDSCGDRHPTLVFDGIALGVQIKKVKSFKDKMRLVLGNRSEKKLGGIKFEDRTFIPLKKNKRFLKECVKGKVWPKDMSDLDLNQGKWTTSCPKRWRLWSIHEDARPTRHDWSCPWRPWWLISRPQVQPPTFSRQVKWQLQDY